MPARYDEHSTPFRVTRDGCQGIGRDVFRSRRFVAPTRGVRLGALVPAGVRTRVAAYLLVVNGVAVASGATAAALWGLPLPGSRGVPPVELTVAPGGSRPVRPGLVAVRASLAPADTALLDGIPVVTVPRLFVELSSRLTVPDLVALGDAILHRGLADEDDLARAVRRWRGRRGVRRARAALDLLDGRAESPQESRLRALIVLAGLPVPVPQFTVRDRAGEFVARVDLAYQQCRIAIEYDGAAHDTIRRRAQDATRRTLLRELGWYVVEIVAADLRFPERALAKVRAALAQTGHPRSTLPEWRPAGA